jgi:carboxymethylenebutenolidase
MSRFSVTIETRDGLCPASLLTPAGQAGPWPAVIFFMDGYVVNVNRDRKISDTAACIDFLMSRPEVEGDRYGVTGYCMGGNVALTAAGAFPGRFAAVASFHGSNLVTDEPDSPHRFVKNITDYVYVAGAVEDAYFMDEQKNCLEEVLTGAAVPHMVETHSAAHHGLAVPDVPSFNLAASDRRWATLFRLLHESFALEP